MTETWAAVLLALASALSQAFGTVMRHRTKGRAGGRLEGRFGVLASRYWWVGMAISLAGFAFQGVALAFGSLILVQTITVLSLTFALPLGAWVTNRRVTKTELFWGHVLAGCVIVLVIYGRPTGGEAHPPWYEWALACAGGVGVVVVLLRLSRNRRSNGNRALLLGVAGGTAFAYVALLTKGVAGRWYEGGLVDVFTSGEVYGLVVAAATALTLQQMSFSAGAVHQAVPASTVTTPVVALGLGVVVLGEWFTVDGPQLAILAATLILMVVATVRLAHKEVDAEGSSEPAGAAGPVGVAGASPGAGDLAERQQSAER